MDNVLVVVGVFVVLAISSLASVVSVVGLVLVFNRVVVFLRHSFWWVVGKVKGLPSRVISGLKRGEEILNLKVKPWLKSLDSKVVGWIKPYFKVVSFGRRGQAPGSGLAFCLKRIKQDLTPAG